MKPERTLIRLALPAVLAVGLIAAIGSPAGAVEKPKATSTLYVAPLRSRAKLPSVCKTAKFSNINAAIKAVAVGGTVLVCPGIYRGSASMTVKTAAGSLTISSGALIETRIRLIGMPGAIINAEGLVNAITIFLETRSKSILMFVLEALPFAHEIGSHYNGTVLAQSS